MDSLPYSITNLTVYADYHNALGQVWSTNTSAYETWTAAHYNSGYYSVAAGEEGGANTGSARYNATTPAALVGTQYFVVFRRHVDGTALNDVPIGSLSNLFQFTGTNVNAQGFVATSGSSAPGNTAAVDEDFTVASGLYWSQTITATGVDSTGWTSFVFTLKEDPATDGDIDALLTVRVTAPATVTNKALTSDVATLTTSAAHGFSVGESVTVASVDSTFNGTWTITAVTPTTISYAVTAGNVASTAATGTIVSNTDGLLVYKGVPATVATNASVTVASYTPNTSVTFTIQAAAMDFPDSGNTPYTWEITRWIGGPSGRKEQIGTGNVTMSRSARRSAVAP